MRSSGRTREECVVEEASERLQFLRRPRTSVAWSIQVQRLSILCLVLALLVLAAASASAAPMQFRDGTSGGGLTFRGDWKTGDVSQFDWGAQCAPWIADPSRGSVSVVRPPDMKGRRAARISLGGAQSACELLHKRLVGLDSTEYYSLEVRFPRTWREPGPWGAAIAQLNYAALGGPPVGLFAHARRVDLVILGGEVTWPGCSGPAQGCLDQAQFNNTNGAGRGGTAIAAPMALGVWHQLVVRVRWSTGSDGTVDVWHRLRGQRHWIRTYHISGVPTMQWAPCCLGRGGANPDGTPRMDADKIGLYRIPNGTNLTLWIAGFFVGRAFAPVSRALP